jgi:hypothetical protein
VKSQQSPPWSGAEKDSTELFVNRKPRDSVDILQLFLVQACIMFIEYDIELRRFRKYYAIKFIAEG